MNIVILQGNVTHTPELKYLELASGKVAVCNFSLALNRHFKRKDGTKDKDTTFVDCEAWDSGAEVIAKYISKGDQLLVKGALKNDSWTNKDDKKITKLKLRIEDFELPRRLPKQNDDVQGDVTTEDSKSVTPQDTPKESPDGNDIPF